MNKELILKSDALDILFENRNKMYGAYQLRRYYDNRLAKSLGLMLIGVLVLSGFTFLPKKQKADKEEVITTMYTIKEADKPKEAEKKKEEPKEQPKEKKQPAEIQKFVDKILIVKTNEKADTVVTLKDNVALGGTNIVKPGGGPAVVVPVVTIPGGDGGPVVTTPVVNRTTPMDIGDVDVAPSYPGGIKKLYEYLQRNLTNPRDLEEGETVSVQVKFVVGYDGKLQGFNIIKDGGDEFNKEVLRVMKKMPEWLPGKSKGENVSVFYTIPVKFVAQD